MQMVAPKIDMKIRRAKQTDAPTLYQVVNEAYRKTGGWTGMRIHRKSRKETKERREEGETKGKKKNRGKIR